MLKKKIVDLSAMERVFEDKHENGLKLTGYGLNRFLYEKCKPESYQYYMEIHSKDKRKKDYFEYLLEKETDMWEYVFHCDEWYCFRKERKGDNCIEIREIDIEKNFKEIKGNLYVAGMMLAIIVFYTWLVNDKSIWGCLICALLMILVIIFSFIVLRKRNFLNNILLKSK